MPTIYESFREAIDPDHVGSGRRGSGAANIRVSDPSHATRGYEPPNFLLRTSESKWLSIADAALDQHKSKLNQKHARLAPWESNMRMDSEGDVVYGSAIYLNNPVHTALHTAQNHSRACDIRSEVTQGTTSRADMGYFRDGRAYAILEYKKVGAVSRRCARREFEYGVPKDGRTFAAWMSRAEHRFAKHQRGVEDTRFLLQQSVHYHKVFGARFVALFDWNVLVLFVLPECRGIGLNDNVNFAYITEVTDNRKFRRALLGFLLFADRNRVGGQLGDLQKIRPDCLSTYAQAYHRQVAEETKHNKSTKIHGPQVLRITNTSYLEIEPQQSYGGPHHGHGRGRTGNQHPYAMGNNQRAQTPDGHQRHAAVTGPGARSHSQDDDRSRRQQFENHANLNNRSRMRDPAPQYQVNLAASTTHTMSNPIYQNAANPATIHTYIPIRGRDDTKSPSRRIRKQPSSGLTTQQGGQAVPYSLSEHSYGGKNHVKGTSEYVGSQNGNSYYAYPGPSNHQVLAASSTRKDGNDNSGGNGSHKKEKNGGKFLGIFKMK